MIRHCCIASIAVWGLASSSTARAESPNEITSVTYSDDGGTTRVRVRGAQTPTFTAYKLEKPSRVVLDIPRAKLSDALRGHESTTLLTTNTWAVSTIAAQQHDDGGHMVRVIIAMARPGRYDVKTENNEVVLFVVARDPAPPKVDADALQKAQQEADRLRRIAAEQAQRADAAQKAADEAKRQGQIANGAQLDKAKADAARAKELAQKAQQDAERMKREIDLAKADANRAKQDADRAKQETDAARADANRAKADASRAKQEIDAAKRDADRAKQEIDAAKRDADRFKQEADAIKRNAEIAKQQVEAAKRDADKAKQDADAIRRDADRAKQEAERAKQEAEAIKRNADRTKQEADAVKRTADRAKQDADRAKQEIDRAKADVDAAKRDADRAKQETDLARAEANRAKQDADRAKQDAERAKKQFDTIARNADRAKQEVDRAKRDADAAKIAAEAARQAALREAAAVKQQALREAELAKAEAEATKRDAERIKAEALAIRANVAQQTDVANKARADADKAKREADAARALATKSKTDADAARRDAQVARDEAARTKAESDAIAKQVDAARRDVQLAKGEADAAKADAAKARKEADQAKADAELAKNQAAMDRKKAEIARADADKAAREAKAQLATLEKKMAQAQALEDKARAANAVAEARDQAARDELIKAKKEREMAEQAAKLATQRVADARTADKTQRETELKAADERLAKAKKAIEDAEARRIAADKAAADAKKQLDQTRVALVDVEKQRSDAELAANNATRKRAEAEAQANDATRRKNEAEIAANEAGKRRKEAEQLKNTADLQRKQAEEAMRVAKQAADAADKQRVIAEKSVRDANAAKQQAEKSLAELTTRRLAAEHAANELEKRSKAEAKAQADILAAKQRKANDAELQKMRTEAGRLADERKRAETELADRRKAVAAQQQLVTELDGKAISARDAANREEKRLAALAQQRQIEEKELARIRAERDAAKVAKVQPKAAPAVKTKKAHVTNVAFKGDAANGDVSIALDGDAKVTIGEVAKTHVELFIDGADIAQKLERKLDVSRYGSPVRAVSSFKDRRNPDRVRLIAELAAPATPTVDRDATGIHWRFASNDAVAQTNVKAAPRTQSIPPPVVSGFGATSTPITQQSVAQVPQGQRRRVYRGATVDFEFKDAPIADLLRIIAETGRVNIVVPDNIKAAVTVRLKRVPWDQALEVILSSHGLWYRREGNLYRIADRKELDKEDKDAAERAEAMRKAETPRPEVVRLNYAEAKDLKAKLQGMVSPNGTLEVDERQNALIINDVQGNREQIQRLALSLDTQTPQISIEARIVEARSTFLRQIGIQWGGRALSTAQGGNTTGLVFPSSIQLVGGNEDAQTIRTGVAAPSDFAINMPANTGSGEGGAIGLSLGSIGGNFALNLRLSALEDSGTVRIISAPKITVLNNKPAKILQGVSIPIQVISAAGTQTQLVQADLKLEVTPHVSSRDCAVQMKIEVSKNEPDFVNVGARGDPSFLRKEASTTMLVQDGDTSVLGGIYTRNSGLAYKKVPFFGDLPVLGWFFKNRRENDDRTEILVFITPKITNKAQLSCQ